jgi:DNA adenine methylase
MKARNLQKKSAQTPRPFLKWAGGKRALMQDIMARLPEGEIDLYIEPFLGGGAVFLDLARQGRIKRAVLNDRNPELIHTWRMVRDDPQGVINAIYQWTPDEETYYAVRALDGTQLSDTDRAGRVLWLNRLCFNGLYRINRSGQFNVPYGKYKKPNLVDEENLFEVSRALQNVTLYDIDFEGLLAMAGPGAVVYCDPPYWPLSDTAYFTAYDGNPFRTDDQERLAASFAALRDQGARGVLSNSWTEQTVELYNRHGLNCGQVFCRRNINRNAAGRGPVPEIMVSTHAQAAEYVFPIAADG